MLLGSGRNHVTMGNQVSVKPAVFIINCMLLDSPSLRFSGPSNNPLQDGIVLLELVLEVTGKLHQEVALTPMSFIIAALMTLISVHTYGLLGSSL